MGLAEAEKEKEEAAARISYNKRTYILVYITVIVLHFDGNDA